MLPVFARAVVWLFLLLLFLLGIVPLCSVGFLVHVEVSPVSSVKGDHPAQKKGQKSESFFVSSFMLEADIYIAAIGLDKHQAPYTFCTNHSAPFGQVN
jgi:hypothetical protein